MIRTAKAFKNKGVEIPQHVQDAIKDRKDEIISHRDRHDKRGLDRPAIDAAKREDTRPQEGHADQSTIGGHCPSKANSAYQRCTVKGCTPALNPNLDDKEGPSDTDHTSAMCGLLHNRCSRCRLRGHAQEECELTPLSELINRFEQDADLGLYTRKRHQYGQIGNGIFYLSDKDAINYLPPTLRSYQALLDLPPNVAIELTNRASLKSIQAKKEKNPSINIHFRELSRRSINDPNNNHSGTDTSIERWPKSKKSVRGTNHESSDTLGLPHRIRGKKSSSA